MKIRIITGVLIGLFTKEVMAANISMFPKAKPGQIRHVIEVPKTKNDYDHKVELIIGKNIVVDCNNHWFTGELQKRNLKGWGYTYFVFKYDKLRGTMSTKMGCRGKKPTKRFIRANMSNGLHRYNSRSPIIIFTPKDIEVHYKIWSAGSKKHTAQTR